MSRELLLDADGVVIRPRNKYFSETYSQDYGVPIEDMDVKSQIESVLTNHPAYGHKRIAWELKLNHKRILRVMKKFGIKPYKRRAKKPWKKDDEGKPETKYSNLIKEIDPINLIQNQTPEKTYLLGTIAVAQNPVTTSYLLVPRVNQDYIDSLSPLRSQFDKPADKNLKLTLQMGSSNTTSSNNVMGGHMMGNGQMMQNQEMTMGEVKKIEWEDDMGMMNAQSTKDTLKWKLVDQVTNKENMDIDWQFKKGDIVKVKVFNDDKSMHPMQHPIHIHGQRFLVLSTDGQKNQNLVWKDTTLIQTGDTVELLVQMDNPGDWVIHCHIPEHMEAGMMSEFKVI